MLKSRKNSSLEKRNCTDSVFVLNVNDDERRQKQTITKQKNKKKPERKLKICYVHYHFFLVNFQFRFSFVFSFLSTLCVLRHTMHTSSTFFLNWIDMGVCVDICRGRWFSGSSLAFSKYTIQAITISCMQALWSLAVFIVQFRFNFQWNWNVCEPLCIYFFSTFVCSAIFWPSSWFWCIDYFDQVFNCCKLDAIGRNCKRPS